jgi:hypothetical protein
LLTTFLYDRGGTLREKIIGFEYTNVVEKKSQISSWHQLISAEPITANS